MIHLNFTPILCYSSLSLEMQESEYELCSAFKDCMKSFLYMDYTTASLHIASTEHLYKPGSLHAIVRH